MPESLIIQNSFRLIGLRYGNLGHVMFSTISLELHIHIPFCLLGKLNASTRDFYHKPARRGVQRRRHVVWAPAPRLTLARLHQSEM